MAIDKTKKFADLAYEYIRKLLVKPSKGGITSLPTEKEITNEMLQMFEKLRGAGYNVTNIGKEVKNADDLGFLINRIDQAQMNQAKEFSDAADALETIQYKLNNNIPLNPEDQKKLLGKGFTTASEAFQGFTPKVIQGGKKEGIEQLLESGDVKKGVAPKTTKETIERKSMIDPKLTEEENIKNMMKENKAAAKRLEQKMNKEKDLGDKLKDFDGDPDAMAEGGIARLGMYQGGIPLRRLLQYLAGTSGKKGSQNLKDMKLSDQIKFFAEKQGFDPEQNRIDYLEQVLESLKADRKLMRGLESDAPSAVTGKAKNKMELMADKMFTENFLADTQKGRFKGMTSKDLDKSILETETMIKNLKTKDRKLNAEGGRALMFKGGISKLIQKFKSKVKDKKAGDKIYGVGGEEIDVADFKKSLGLDEATDKKGMEDLEKKLQMIIGKDRTKHNMGGRIGFKEGSGMSRRTFLKLLGGLASIPLVGKFLKPAAKVAKTAEVAKQSGVPAYFPKLVEKIKLLGDDITDTAATAERQRVIDYKDYTLTEDISTGAITIDKKTEGGGMFRVGDDLEYESGTVREERMEYTPPSKDFDPKTKKVIEYPAEYEEVTVRPDFEGKMKDVDFGLDSMDEILKEVGESKIKKSGGGLAYMLGE